MTEPLIRVKDLRLTLEGYNGDPVEVLQGVDFEIRAGEALALVGESGSGKSMTARSLISLLPERARQTGDVIFAGEQLSTMTQERLRRYRARDVAMIFQDSRAHIDATRTIGDFLNECARAGGLDGAAAARRVVELLDAVQIQHPEQCARQYPHELSGGMLQRVMIASALAADPALLLADEPTTALDVTVQAEIVALLKQLQRERGVAILFITHDLDLAEVIGDQIAVMHRGRIVDSNRADLLMGEAKDPYTLRLLNARPSMNAPRPPTSTAEADVVVDVRALTKSFARRGRRRPASLALRDVTFQVRRGESVAVVGESGSGKTTLARILVGLESATSGSALVGGVQRASRRRVVSRRALARRAQIVFQDPYASLNPRRRVGSAIGEVISHVQGLRGAELHEAIAAIMRQVELDPELASRFPRRLSGGQRQRVAIARALAAQPEILVLDEAVASLDVSIQGQILALLRRLQDESGITYLFITHDLSVVRAISDRVLVLYRGDLVEDGTARRVLEHPQQEYTRQLINSAPDRLRNTLHAKEHESTDGAPLDATR